MKGLIATPFSFRAVSLLCDNDRGSLYKLNSTFLFSCYTKRDLAKSAHNHCHVAQPFPDSHLENGSLPPSFPFYMILRRCSQIVVWVLFLIFCSRLKILTSHVCTQALSSQLINVLQQEHNSNCYRQHLNVGIISYCSLHFSYLPLRHQNRPSAEF